MAATLTSQGLRAILSLGFGINSLTAIGSMTADNSATAFTTATTTLGSPASLHVMTSYSAVGGAAADPYPVDATGTIAAASFGGVTITRIALHTGAAPTGSSATVAGGVDGLSLLKATTFSLIPTVRVQLDAI